MVKARHPIRAPFARQAGGAAPPGPGRISRTRLRRAWAQAIAPEHWSCYRQAMAALRQADVPFLLGGGFALATYTGRWRNTKDIDLYIFQRDRPAAVEALKRVGFEDYFSTLPYQRHWIYRGTRDGLIVDLIWAMANRRAEVDAGWFERAPAARVRGETLRVVPMAEFLWCKLYILQRDHCDWPDVFNLLYAAGPQVDWSHLLRRLGGDWPLLSGLLSVYGWLCPKRARLLPGRLRTTLRLSAPGIPRRQPRDRIRLLDSRRWFSAWVPNGEPLEV